jgi:hypothetical protein
MLNRDRPRRHRWAVWFCAIGLMGVGYGGARGEARVQSEADVGPDASPAIGRIQPREVAAGSEVTLKIAGQNFSRGAYVSFSVPAVRVISTRRISATELEAQVAISKKAQPGKASLYVSNPASSVAEVPFGITDASSPPVAATAEVQPARVAAPEVAAVEPARATRGSQLAVKITGKNFASGAKVAFSNQGIRVLESSTPKPTELVAQIKVAPDAAVGKTSLFVVNPDDTEAEVAFEVADGAAPTRIATSEVSPGAKTADSPLRFEVFNLGEATSILQSPSKAKGTLTVAGGKLKYEENGSELFSAAPGDIKEIDMNTYFGVKTPVFRVSLNSGKTYNLVSVSLQTSDGQSMVDSIRRALR